MTTFEIGQHVKDHMGRIWKIERIDPVGFCAIRRYIAKTGRYSVNLYALSPEQIKHRGDTYTNVEVA